MQEENQKKTSGLNLHSAKNILRKYSDAKLIPSSGDYLLGINPNIWSYSPKKNQIKRFSSTTLFKN